MTKSRKFLNKLGLKLIAFALILVGVFLFAEASFRPMIEEINAYECHEAVSRIINDAVLAELDRSGADYSSLVTLSSNGDGEITSVQSNVVNINRLKTNVNERVEREIERLSAMEFRIPVGTLHRIIIEISADVDALIPGYQTRVPVKTSIVAAETVIVGRVPDAYTHVVTGSGELAGTLNDYGAENYIQEN